MRIHHLNCGTMCPLGGKLFDGVSDGITANLVCHCLLIETEQGLVLVDTGFGIDDVRQPLSRLSPLFVTTNNVQLREEDTALRAVERLGFSAGDVRHIVVTHLDFDHAGGIEDFPNATVHVFARELEAARGERNGIIASQRYRPRQWDEAVNWQSYRPGGEDWFGFEAVRDLKGLPPEILLIPLVGHTWGHCGVAVRDGQGWLLHAGDAYFFHGEMDLDAPHCPPGFAGYQRMMEVDRDSRLANQERLRGLLRGHGGEVRVFCSHDQEDLKRFG
ncbi:MBL fold metallo-hydrolase [Azospirillum sp. SYSU D00513]|uniref:MBL fold metallo-hydrolase n=1 Tax=Azospirillum sp. SYSU D00513 TaxID=2812561 RepID=UPI001A962BC0|nr:MBL fold metallo-hydrolase [Azospirillum sp. SYSU D00513]